MAAQGVVLAARALCKRLGERPIVQGLNLDVGRGECLALLGPSGAGKTTLIRCLSGQLPPDDGQVLLEGHNVDVLGRSRRRRVAVVFQQFNLVGRISALDNVLAGRLGYLPVWRAMLGRFEPCDRLQALQCLERVGMLEHAGRRADTLSGGQQQRVAIARALAQQPAVILADEPIASLDPVNGAAVLDLLRDIARTEGVAVVCSLHQLELAVAWADRILGMAPNRPAIDLPAHRFDADTSAHIYGWKPEFGGIA
jgi:phosphonate transport system ATP-binding protein